MYTDKHGAKWWKGNLHTHTTESDGHKSPAEAIKLYKDHGYDFLAITDHWKRSQTYIHENGLLVLSGCEYDFGSNVRDGIFHIVAVGFESDPMLERSMTPNEAVAKIHASGGTASLAHPAWSLNNLAQLMPLEGIDYSEIFNTTSDLPRNFRPDSSWILDAMAAQGKFWRLAATDDTHTYVDDPVKSFVYLKAEECTRDAVMTALKNGDFYASQGPRMEIVREGDTVNVFCPEEDRIHWVIAATDTPWEPHRTEHGEAITSASFTFSKAASWMRIEIIDADENRAWSAYIVK